MDKKGCYYTAERVRSKKSQDYFIQEQKMESLRSNLRYEWKKYVVALWMILVTIFVFSMNNKINRLITKIETIDSTMSSTEGIVSGSDYTLGNIEQKISSLEKKVAVINNRVKRLR